MGDLNSQGLKKKPNQKDFLKRKSIFPVNFVFQGETTNKTLLNLPPGSFLEKKVANFSFFLKWGLVLGKKKGFKSF